MSKGSRRYNIMLSCPEEFHDDLKEWIDELESDFSSIVNLLDIKDVNDLDQIAEAKDLIDDLATELY